MNATARLLLAFALLLSGGILSASGAHAADPALPRSTSDPGRFERERGRVDAALAALRPQRPGMPDMYVVGFGGDSSEDVFRNETDYLEKLMVGRFGAAGRVISLINHADSLETKPRPLATLENLRRTLAGVGRAMDPEQDLLLLFMTMHGTPQHQLFVRMDPAYMDLIDPEELRKALDDAGIRNRVLVISACYSGGFVPALRDERTLVLTASHRSRPSFGCGADSDATYFGRAWMIEGLNETTDFIAAFESAKGRIESRERSEGFRPSRPQINTGDAILPLLTRWRDQLNPGPPIAFDYPRPTRRDAAPATMDKIRKLDSTRK